MNVAVDVLQIKSILGRSLMKARRAYEQKLKKLSKLSRSVEKQQKYFMNVDLMYENIGTNATIHFLKISQQVFANLTQTWKNLQLFNDRMSTQIKVSLGEQLKKLFEYGKRLDISETNLAREYANDYLQDPSFECSTMAYIIQHQSQLYVNVSKKFIIPAVSKLETLNSFDPIQGCRKQGGCKLLINEKLQEIDTFLSTITAKKEAEIRNNFEKFTAKFEKRMKSLQEAFNENKVNITEEIEDTKYIFDELDDDDEYCNEFPDDCDLTPLR